MKCTPKKRHTELGWEYNYQFLEKIADEVSKQHDFCDMETVELVMKALENELGIKFKEL